MLPGLGFTEILVVGLIALLVVGPKDLPTMLRKLGRIMAKMRAMGNDLRAGFDEIARQAELDELKREVEAMRRHHTFTDIDREMRPTWTPPQEGPAEPSPEKPPPAPSSDDEAAAPAIEDKTIIPPAPAP